ncbi:hypothetical protein FDH59_gp40 [Arthrobacter phage Joann]|uniref:Uncharacterized protein n=1 Tax=Arthrobacter phage Joann TaxID=1772303 RepID=A0A0U4K8F5_9CAUD|nr:hypothetical protein FDH59_gp40 [Arthrobacter phage Joann]ALY09443.1 hypothetical protein JOANN_40 [Arthrobacter phage Joann]
MFGLPDSILLAFALLCFFAALFFWGRWREEVQLRQQTQIREDRQAEFTRLYKRYRVARQLAYREFLDAGETIVGQSFKFPSFAEWVEDRGEDN